MQKKISIVILAAGKGTRMNSNLPKVLHKLAGKPMVKHVIDTVKKLQPQQIHLVYGFGADNMQAALAEEQINWVYQAEQLGTGHAMQQASPFFADDEQILMLYADGPLISAKTLSKLIEAQPKQGISLLTVDLEQPFGYGRIIRNENHDVIAIVEEKDATVAQRQITEINTGIMVASGKDFKRWLAGLNNDNAQQEYYITDVVALAYAEGNKIQGVMVENAYEVIGVNSCEQLADLERIYQKIQAKQLLQQGVTLADPARFDLRGELICGKDVSFDVNVIIEGKVIIGNNVKIGAGSILKNVTIADNVSIQPYSVIEDSEIGVGAIVGPFARLRPGTKLDENTRIGNFVEIKKATIKQNSKVNHLTYIGDAEIGMNCNIGAGVITCNYDGANKFKTIIGNNVFVGSDVQLVAPVTVADNSTIGAGTTVTKNIDESGLVVSRVAQRHIKNWQRPIKIKK